MANQLQPIFILPEGTQRSTGKDAQRNNILAAKAVAETVRTTLGPKGMDKMIVDSMGDITVTNDGVTILEEMQIAHSDNYASLMEKLAGLSVKMLVKTLPEIMEGKSKPEPQDESQATYTKKFTSEDAYIDLKKDNPKEIWLKIRALNPEPGIYTILELKNGKKLRLKLLEAEFLSNELKLAKVQPEGKRPMSYQAFLNGYSKLLN
mgnify:CR=1 FL=1